MYSHSIKNICCIGAGYVGGPTMSVLAEKCPNLRIEVVDLNKKKIDLWNHKDLKKLPVFENGLEEIIKNVRNKNLFFNTNVEGAIKNADMVFISVNTPTKLKGLGAGKASDLKWVEACAKQVAKFSKGHTIVVEKSTIPVRTASLIKSILINNSKSKSSEKTFSVLSNPEFLSEGTAIKDLRNPDRVLIGGDEKDAIKSLKEIYLNWIDKEKIIETNIWSSELSKLTANAFLAQRISSINSISALCEVTGANIDEVSLAIGKDSRIGNNFLKAGPGFGGSCFKKDILNLTYLCEHFGLNEVAKYWEQVLEINKWQQHRIYKEIIMKLFGTVSNKKISILGFSFKANTNDIRESPAIKICIDLLEEGAFLEIHDPQVNPTQIKDELFKKNAEYKNKIAISNNLQNVFKESSAVIILTEWAEYKELDWHQIKSEMESPAWVFDSRGITNAKYLKDVGLNIWKLGFGDLDNN